MKKIKEIALFIIFPIVIGGISSLVSDQSLYSNVYKPSFSPPGYLFAIV